MTEPPLQYSSFYVNGTWVDPIGTGQLEVIDSTAETVFALIPEGTREDADLAVAAARAAFPAWAALAPVVRGELLTRVADLMEERRDEMAAIITHELGMPLKQSGLIQVGSGISTFRMAGELAGTFAFEEHGDSLIIREPIGVVGAITPLELPAQSGRREGGLCIGCRLYGGA